LLKLLYQKEKDTLNFLIFLPLKFDNILNLLYFTKAIEKHVFEVENEIEKIAEGIDVSTIENDLLIDFIQKQQVSSAIAISLLRKKINNE